MRPLLMQFALLMIAPSLMGKATIIQPKRLSIGSITSLSSKGRSIASIDEIQKELEVTIKEKLDKKKGERDAAKLEVAQNEKDENCEDELKASKEKLEKLEAEVKELEDFKFAKSNDDQINCLAESLAKSKSSVLSGAIANLIAQQQYALTMYQDMQTLLLGYQIQNMYFEISKPTYSDLGQQSLSLNSILGLTPTIPWTLPQQPLPQVVSEGFNFSTEESLASEAYNRMVPDVSRNPLYTPNWGGFSLGQEQGQGQSQEPVAQAFNFGSPDYFQYDASVTETSENYMYKPSFNGFSNN